MNKIYLILLLLLSSISSIGQKMNLYNDLRNRALNVSKSELKLENVSNDDVFGVVMDWATTNGMATLVCYQTGDASIYLSSGGGFIGGIQNSNVSTKAKAFVANAQRYVSKAAKAESFPLPDRGCVQFYLLTSKGIYSRQIETKNLWNNSSDWVPLFNDANNVITEYRKINEKRKK